MSKPYSSICLQCAKRYTPPSFWCDQCQVVILPGPELLAEIHNAAKNLQKESQNFDWVLNNVTSWKDRNKVSTEEEKYLVNIFQNLKNQIESEITKENQLTTCLLNLRSLLLLDQVEKDLPSKIKKWQDGFANDMPPMLEKAVRDLCGHLKQRADQVLAEKAKSLETIDPLTKDPGLEPQIISSILGTSNQTGPSAPDREGPIVSPENPLVETKISPPFVVSQEPFISPKVKALLHVFEEDLAVVPDLSQTPIQPDREEPIVFPEKPLVETKLPATEGLSPEPSISPKVKDLLHAFEDDLAVIPDPSQFPIKPAEDLNGTAPAFLNIPLVSGKPPTLPPPPTPKPQKSKAPLVVHHWKEGTTRWIKALKPFLLDNVGWFVGGFLVLAGFSYLIATLWNTLSQNPILWRTLVFLCLFGSTGFFTFLGHYLLKKHPNLELSGMVFLTIGTLMFPMVMVCAMMIALLPPSQDIQPEPRSAGTSQVNP